MQPIITTPSVSATCPAYDEMQIKWAIIADLTGGTLRMREAGKTWLAIEPGESEAKWKLRRDRSILFNGFNNAVRGLASRPFSKPITMTEPLPARLGDLEDNVNLEGQNLSTWMRSVYEDALRYGLTHVLVDYPVVPDAGSLDRISEEQRGARPYFVHVPATDLFFWSSSRDANGVRSLDEVRFYQTIEERDGEFGLKSTKLIRRYTRTTWETHVQTEDGEWVRRDGGAHSFGRVPLHTLYLDWKTFMQATPPLEDLAWLNVAHWQSYSDQRNILRVMRTAVMFAKCFGDSDSQIGEGRLVMGPNIVVRASDPASELMYVEHSGKGLEAGDKDLHDIEERMVQLGLRPFIERTNARTATTAGINDTNASTDSLAWTATGSRFVTELCRMAAQWVKLTLPDTFAAKIHDDYGAGLQSGEDKKLLLEARKARDLTRRTFLNELKRRSVLPDSLDIEAELADLEAEESTASIPMNDLSGLQNDQQNDLNNLQNDLQDGMDGTQD